MFKKITILLLVLSSQINAQVNLVVNPSFESYTACPSNTGGDVYKAVGWDTCKNTPDYFNTCATYSYFIVPNNFAGYQQPAQGNAYAGLYTYDASSFYREIIIGQLTTSLTVGQKYYISFKASRADCDCIMGHSTNKLGVKFTKVKQFNASINNTAHYFSNQVITDTLNWTTLFGTFIADSAYQYMMVGNFFDDLNTTIVNDGPASKAYYYVDKFCLSTDSVFCSSYNAVGMQEEKMNLGINFFFPNPTDKLIQISFNDFIIYNSQGCEVLFERTETPFPNVINVEKWPEGIYFISTKTKKYKFIINH